MTVRRTLALAVGALLLLSGASTVLSVRARQRTSLALADVQRGQQVLQRLLALDREIQLRYRELSVLRELSPTAAQLHLVEGRLASLDTQARRLPVTAFSSRFLVRYRALGSSWHAAVDDLRRGAAVRQIASPVGVAEALLDWRSAQERDSEHDAARFAEAVVSADRITLALLICSCLLGTGVIVAISVTLSGGFRRLDDASRHVASGDYRFRLDTRGADEFARAARTFNDMAAALEASTLQLQEARVRAEGASTTKSRFLTSLCHDLKSPLTAILGYADAIEADVHDAGLAAPASDIRQLRRSARVLLAMVGELLDYARLEVGRMPIAWDAMEPARLVDEVAATLRPLFDERGTTLVLTDLGGGVVTTDHAKVRHILLNLLGNACKFTRGGRVEVTVRPLADVAGVRIEVADTGIGMTEAEAARVFAPYVQANGEIAQRYGGTGLGLAISKQFAQLLGGDITVLSRAGVGSTFVLILPDHGAALDGGIDTQELDEAVALFAAIDRPRETRLSA